MRERLISCERGCQRGPEWAVWSFCQRVSNFHGPHCGPLSCSWPHLNGPFDGPPEAFHHAPCHGARGPGLGSGRGGVGSCRTTPGRMEKNRMIWGSAQTRAVIRHVTVYGQEVSGLILVGPLHFPYTCPCFPPPILPFYLPLPHTQQAHPRDHPLPPLSAVQSLLTELSPDGKRERKQLSAAVSQSERNSPPTAAWLTGLYCLIPRRREVGAGGERERARSVRRSQHLHTELSTDKRAQCLPLRESGVMR
ncbi:hypothetical protein L3Q82_026620 [Scortum barcoo]|uniref:Uncharacterized protein n=1 Tax=Scortum barcoo TaxID=214431 RepID=A0ACB8WJK6_9TELE|nr:hypothetical protein L3Q82_026620 [Scortum barcoo]